MIGPPEIRWWNTRQKVCLRDHHPPIPTALTALKYLDASELGPAVVQLVKPTSATPLPEKTTWLASVPLASAGLSCRGLASSRLRGNWGPLYRLLLDASYAYWQIAQRVKLVPPIHPIDAFLRFAPVPQFWTEGAPADPDANRSGQRQGTLVVVLSRHNSKTTLLSGAKRAIGTAKLDFPGRQRWIAGAGTSPLRSLVISECWIILELDLRYSVKSLQRAVQERFLGSRRGLLEFTPRRRPTPQIVVGLWVFYRRLADPQVTSPALLGELNGRLAFKDVPFEWDLDRLCFRFSKRLLETLTSRCGALDRRRVASFLPAADPPQIPRQ